MVVRSLKSVESTSRPRWWWCTVHRVTTGHRMAATRFGVFHSVRHTRTLWPVLCEKALIASEIAHPSGSGSVFHWTPNSENGAQDGGSERERSKRKTQHIEPHSRTVQTVSGVRFSGGLNADWKASYQPGPGPLRA